jgi:hypothetical protein
MALTRQPGGQVDRKAMHYFCNFAALDLSGYLPGHFWDQYVLQHCQTDAIV